MKTDFYVDIGKPEYEFFFLVIKFLYNSVYVPSKVRSSQECNGLRLFLANISLTGFLSLSQKVMRWVLG